MTFLKDQASPFGMPSGAQRLKTNNIKMKKTYIIPQTEVLQINVQSPLLNTSDPDVSYDANEYMDADEVNVKGNGRGFNLWGDDDWE